MCLAVPGKVTAILGDGDARAARVDFGGVSRDASLLFLPDARIGDYVLVHVGVAIAVVDEQAARDTLALVAAADARLREQGSD